MDIVERFVSVVRALFECLAHQEQTQVIVVHFASVRHIVSLSLRVVANQVELFLGLLRSISSQLFGTMVLHLDADVVQQVSSLIGVANPVQHLVAEVCEGYASVQLFIFLHGLVLDSSSVSFEFGCLVVEFFEQFDFE